MARTKNIANELLEVKLEDIKVNSGMMPRKARALGKMFAKSLGGFAGRVVQVYDNMFQQIEEGEDVESVQKSIRRDVNSKSKIKVKPPLMKPRDARICGLVALNHAGFFDSEVKFYSELMGDLKDRDSSEGIAERSRQVGSEKPLVYGSLLRERQQSIHDYGVLMGLVDDTERFEELKEDMPEDARKYFNMVARMHKGGKLGITIPFSLKKFSEPVRDGLKRDTISCSVSEGVESDFGFARPERAPFAEAVEYAANASRQIASSKISWGQRLRTATALPAAVYFLSGAEAYAQNYSNGTKTYSEGEVLEAATTAGLFAATSSDKDPEEAITTFGVCLTTLL